MEKTNENAIKTAIIKCKQEDYNILCVFVNQKEYISLCHLADYLGRIFIEGIEIKIPEIETGIKLKDGYFSIAVSEVKQYNRYYNI